MNVHEKGRAAASADGSEKASGGENVAELLLAVGRQVRTQRSRRNMTRRELSRRTDISERYLGEVEKGRANITLGLLMRVCDTLGEPLSAFLPLDDTATRVSSPLAKLLARMSPNQQAALYRRLLRETKAAENGVRGVALIGLRGAGKSTLGEMLARANNVPFVRLTDAVQDLAGMPMGEMLEMMGANAYRRLERQALEKIVERHPSCVIEAGGGLVLETDTFNLLMQNYRVFWLRAAPEDHMQRVLDQGDLRPMAGHSQAMEELRLILKERDPYYAQADHAVQTSGQPLQKVFDDLNALARPYLARR